MSIYFQQGNMHRCHECGVAFEEQNMIQLAGAWICANCKPIVVQKLKEGVRLDGTMEFAGFWIRFWAKFLDGIIQYIFVFLLLMLLGLLIGLTDVGDQFPVLYNFFNVIGLVLSAAYTTFFLGKFGATPGKMAFRLKVVTADGDDITYLRALGRHFAEMLNAFTMLLGYVIAAFDGEKRALHDHICRTRVIKR